MRIIARRHRHRDGWNIAVYITLPRYRRFLTVGWFHGPEYPEHLSSQDSQVG